MITIQIWDGWRTKTMNKMTAEQRNQRIDTIRYHVSLDIEAETDYSYDVIYRWLKKNKFAENYDDYELYNKPINTDEIIDCMDNDY